MQYIDAHIHLDRYKNVDIVGMLDDSLEAAISVSADLQSCKRNLELAKRFAKVKPAFGYHPEQQPPTEQDIEKLLQWMEQNQANMIAVGEVGLPYYLKKEQKISLQQYEQYKEILELFIIAAKKWQKPIVLHAIYNDAPAVCDLLEKHSIAHAHFHWFKGDMRTLERLAANGYVISAPPEVVYKEKIKKIVAHFPLEKIMVETDGPWPYSGPFTGKLTHPTMLACSLQEIAQLKRISVIEAAAIIRKTTKDFFMLN